MTFLEQQHLWAGVLFALLLLFEVAYHLWLRARVPYAVVPLVVRAALLFAYVAITNVNVLLGLRTNWEIGLVVGVALLLVVAIVGRPGVRLDPSTAIVVANVVVEELIFRGAFLLPTAVTPAGTIFGLIGSSATNTLWDAPAVVAERRPLRRSIGMMLALALVLGAITALTRSLWPALLMHAGLDLADRERLTR